MSNTHGKLSAVLNSADIDRALKRISHEIIERNHGISNVVLMGIPTRGAFLAERLAKINQGIETSIPQGTLGSN